MSRKFGTRSQASLTGVHPDLQRITARALLLSPVDFQVIEGLRTVARQKELVARGASKTMDSRHIQGCAVDLWPIGKDGKLLTSGTKVKEKALWTALGEINHAMKSAATFYGVPLVWGGDWQSFKDGPHFELRKSVYPNGTQFASLDPATLTGEAQNELV